MSSFRTQAELLAHLQRQAGEDGLIRHQEFLSAFEQLPERSTLPEQLVNAVKFAGDQYARWRLEWDFSPMSSPNTVARREADEWNTTFESFLNELARHVPDIRSVLQEYKVNSLLFHMVIKARAFNRTQPLKWLWAPTLSWIARQAWRLRLRKMGATLQEASFYPRDSVGRSSHSPLPQSAVTNLRRG